MATVVNIRLPRILVVVMVGAALAVAAPATSGVLFKNPSCRPTYAGAPAGASFRRVPGAAAGCLTRRTSTVACLRSLAPVAGRGEPDEQGMVNKYGRHGPAVGRHVGVHAVPVAARRS